MGAKWSGHGLVIIVGQEERVSCLSIFGSWIWVVYLSCLLGYHTELGVKLYSHDALVCFVDFILLYVSWIDQQMNERHGSSLLHGTSMVWLVYHVCLMREVVKSPRTYLLLFSITLPADMLDRDHYSFVHVYISISGTYETGTSCCNIKGSQVRALDGLDLGVM